MCSTIAGAVIIAFVGGPSSPLASEIGYDSKSPFMALLDRAATGLAPHIAGPLHLHLDDTATYSLTNAESTEEQQGYTYNSYYAPSTLNFHDIYSNNLGIAEDPIFTTTKGDDNFHLSNVPTQYVEFHPQTQTIPPSTLPPPMYLLNASLLKNETDEAFNSTTSTTSTTTEEPEEINIHVIPIKKNYQRGVLDLLFPASRVKTFKSVFDTFRRIMSHTFR